jgi:glycosyltransferase involved in cell wall biosynthesis
MAAGKPVIVTRTASLPELLVENETGFVVPPNDLGALRQRIEQFVSNPELSKSMGQAARRHVQKNFTWEQAAKRGLDFYRTL